MARGQQRDELAEAIVENDEMLRNNNDRKENESTWRDIEAMALPKRARFREEIASNVHRYRHILDSTAPRALELFAAFLFAIMSNPASRWLSIEGEDEDPEGPMGRWFEAVTRLVLRKMASQATNLYVHLHTNYMDLGAYGTDVLYIREHRGDIMARANHLADVTIEDNEFGFVDAITRQEMLWPRQAIQRWGEANPGLGKSIEVGKKKAADKVRFLHAVRPVDDPLFKGKLRDRDRFGPFVGVWVNAADRTVVERTPFQELPYIVSRWNRSAANSPYGRSPAMTVLPDIRMTNRMLDTILRGVEKLVDPPLLFPDGGLVSPIRLFPGGISYGDGNVKPEPLIPPGASRIDLGEVQLEQRRAAIRDGFFVPLFVTPDSPVKTATQVLQEVDERNRAAAPMLVRVQAEKFHPMIARFFNVMARNGMLPQPPQEVRPGSLRARYVSPLLSAQRQIDSLNLLRLAESLAPWVQADGTIVDNFDTDEIARLLHRAQGVDATVLRGRGAVTRLRQGRAQQAQQTQQLLDASSLGETVRNVAQADLASAKARAA